MTASSMVASWLEPVARELKSLRLSLRPSEPDGFFFGFLFRLVAAIVAVVWSTVAIVLVILVTRIFSDDAWSLSDGLLIAYGILILLTIWIGEHLRSRVYERVVRDRPRDKRPLAAEEDVAFRTRRASEHPAVLRRSPPRSLLIAKRALDIGFTLFVIVLIAPLLISIAALIKFDSPGPVFRRQLLVGVNGRKVSALKFRTTYLSRDSTENEVQEDSNVTRAGLFLRRTSLDELPQFFDVLRGDMSVVGPRPRRTEAPFARLWLDERYYGWVQPGITGWAQVNGWRGNLSEKQERKRLEYDLYYIEHMSIALDLFIICKTALGGFAGRQ
jgi:lipopolysaccharide/colanic/teichoic acid biosynthesis glycosyltransferase